MATMTLDTAMPKDHVEAFFTVSHRAVKGQSRRPHYITYLAHSEMNDGDDLHVGRVSEKSGAVAVLRGIIHLVESTPAPCTIAVVTSETLIRDTLCGDSRHLDTWVANGGKNASGKKPDGYDYFLEVEAFRKAGRVVHLRKYIDDDDRDAKALELVKDEANWWKAPGANVGIWDRDERELWDDELRAEEGRI
jgi:hypothetical protein